MSSAMWASTSEGRGLEALLLSHACSAHATAICKDKKRMSLKGGKRQPFSRSASDTNFDSVREATRNMSSVMRLAPAAKAPRPSIEAKETY